MEGGKCIIENIQEILELILKINIVDIEFSEVEHFNSIIEYDFSLFKINLVDDRNNKSEVYLKMTRGGKIKETIFCYWSWLYEEYYKNNEEKVGGIPKRAVISQRSANDSSSKVILTLNPDLNYCAEIHFVKLKKFVKNNKKLERWLDELEINDDDILFIGIKRY